MTYSLYVGNTLVHFYKASTIDHVWILKHFLYDENSLQKIHNKQNLHVHNNLNLKFIKEKLTELSGKVDKFTVLMGYFCISPSNSHKSSKQKIHKNTGNMNDLQNSYLIYEFNSYKIITPIIVL